MQSEILYVFMPEQFVRITIKTRAKWTQLQGSCLLRVISYSTCLRPDKKFESLWSKI